MQTGVYAYMYTAPRSKQTARSKQTRELQWRVPGGLRGLRRPVGPHVIIVRWVRCLAQDRDGKFGVLGV